MRIFMISSSSLVANAENQNRPLSGKNVQRYTQWENIVRIREEAASDCRHHKWQTSLSKNRRKRERSTAYWQHS